MMCLSCVACGSCVVPSMIGTLGPYTSASSKPTLWPSFTSASARFTAIVVLPTPPLPLATATRFFTPGIGWRSGICCGAGPGGIRLRFLLAETEERFLGCAGRRFPAGPESSIAGAKRKKKSARSARNDTFAVGLHHTPKRRGTSCTSFPSRKDKARCGRLLHPRARASGLQPAPDPSGTADRAAVAAACAPFHAQIQEDAVARWRARRRWPRRQRRSEADDAAAPAAALAVAAAARPAESECGRGSALFRCRCAPSCPRRARTLPS